MSPAQVFFGDIVARHWDEAHGLRETEQSFHSLEELYARCLDIDNPEIIDRIVIRGVDAAGHVRVLTFVFQSITVSPHTAP